MIRDTWRRIGQIDVLILCHDVDRALTIDGRAYSQLLDPVREELIEAGHAVGVLAHRFSVLTGEKAHGSPFSCSRTSLVSAVADRLARVVPWMRVTDGASERAIRFWEKLLRLTEAKVVLLIGSPPELCIAGHRRGVPVVELLHGFRFDSIPWGFDQRDAASLPSHILALDDLSFQTFESLRSRSVQTFKVRQPSVGTQQSIRSEQAMPSASFSPQKRRDSDGFTVLVALQWGYCDDEEAGGQFSNGLFPEALTDFVENAGRRIDWIFRLHPVQLRNSKYREHRSIVRDLQQLPNVLDFDGSQGPLPVLLSKADLLLTPASSSASEAISMGVPVVFYDSNPSMRATLEEQYRQELASGEARFWDWHLRGLEQIFSQVHSLPPKVRDPDDQLLQTASVIVAQLLG
jgi:hypothetical protein